MTKSQRIYDVLYYVTDMMLLFWNGVHYEEAINFQNGDDSNWIEKPR